jgi:hypothetical protein
VQLAETAGVLLVAPFVLKAKVPSPTIVAVTQSSFTGAGVDTVKLNE